MASKKKNQKLEEKKKETRNTLLMAALEVFRDKGFNEAKVKDITKRANKAVGSFYNYFEAKEDIFTELITGFYELLKGNLEDLNKQEIPSFKAIKELFRGYMNVFMKHKEIALIFIEQLGGIKPKFTKMKFDFIDTTTAITEKIIARIVELGVARKQNPELSARAWTGTLLEAFRWYVRYGSEEMTEDEWVEEVTTFLIMGTIAK